MTATWVVNEQDRFGSVAGSFPCGTRLVVDGEPMVAVTERTDGAHDLPLERVGTAHLVMCARCKRLVLPQHRCHGDQSDTCYVHACGLPVYDRSWHGRARRGYCYAHAHEAQERPDEREIEMPDTHDRRRDSRRVLMNVHPETRQRLRDALAADPSLGPGYTEFIDKALDPVDDANPHTSMVNAVRQGALIAYGVVGEPHVEAEVVDGRVVVTVRVADRAPLHG